MTDASPSRELGLLLSRLRRRQRRLQTVVFTVRGVFYGIAGAAVVGGVGAIADAEWVQHRSWLPLLCVPLGVLLGSLAGLFRGIDGLRLARALDRASASDDRFASALQLTTHHRAARVRLLARDALNVVRFTPTKLALPLRYPWELKWLPVPLVVLAGVFWLAPTTQVIARPADLPEVSDQEWLELEGEFRRQLDQLPEPETPEDREMSDKLEELASLLKEKPDKRAVLAHLARLREELKRQQEANGTRNISMRQAAQQVRHSSVLQSFASLLRQGGYQKAAEELRRLADQLRKNELRLNADDFEALATDFDRLSTHLAEHEQLSKACRNCANAANSMNRVSLADALQRLSQQLGQNVNDLRRCDRTCKTRSLLDDLQRRLNRCRGCCKGPGKCRGCASCGQGPGEGWGMRGGPGGKGGLRPGWGTAADWRGGGLENKDEQRLPVLAETRDRGGSSTSFSAVSKEERARSAQEYRELYAELVRKAEADLNLDAVPVSYREYLRRYFVAIRPSDATEESPAGQ